MTANSTIHRRALLSGALWAFFARNPAFAFGQDGTGDYDFATLQAFVDVLLPADALSPGASAIGVADEVSAIAQAMMPFHQLISLGVGWLNNTGGPPFHKLTQEQQIRVVDWMSRADFNQIPRRFYYLVRLSAVEIYYAHPDAQAGFALNTAPQPQGYPPPWV